MASAKQIEVLKSLYKRNFNALETYRILKTRPTWLWSWGFRKPAYNDTILYFRVSGFHHKGYVAITLNWDDVYIVTFLNVKWEIKETIENVYVDELLDLLDRKIERRADYDLTVK